VGKVLGRERASPGGVGYGGIVIDKGISVTAVAVANAAGDVIAEDGTVLGGPHDDAGRLVRSAELFTRLSGRPDWAVGPGQSTTLVCVCTDAPLDKRGCAIVARITSAGIARAVDPAFTPNDGDVVFCVASGSQPGPPPGFENSWMLTMIGTAAATVTAAAIRDAIRQAST
jgi:L-aminopeptidase/D-esterase-like protein